jgi:hypothetical protein
MSTNFVRACFSLLALSLFAAAAACTGPPGPPGPQGPPGPPGGGGSGGPPYVWICEPAFFVNTQGNGLGSLYVFNGGSSSANVSVNILNVSGTNLSGTTAIPNQNANGMKYPGQANGDPAVAVAPAHTEILSWWVPDSPTPATTPPNPDVSTTVRVTSDQPITVSTDFPFNGHHPVPCSLLPK